MGGIIILYPKRRRTEEENIGPLYNMIMGFNQDGLPKNGHVAGSGFQARLSWNCCGLGTHREFNS